MACVVTTLPAPCWEGAWPLDSLLSLPTSPSTRSAWDREGPGRAALCQRGPGRQGRGEGAAVGVNDWFSVLLGLSQQNILPAPEVSARPSQRVGLR